MKNAQPVSKEQIFLLQVQYVLSPWKQKPDRSNKGKKDIKQLIVKQHADNQSEMDTSHRGGKGEKEGKIGREK